MYTFDTRINWKQQTIKAAVNIIRSNEEHNEFYTPLGCLTSKQLNFMITKGLFENYKSDKYYMWTNFEAVQRFKEMKRKITEAAFIKTINKQGKINYLNLWKAKDVDFIESLISGAEIFAFKRFVDVRKVTNISPSVDELKEVEIQNQFDYMLNNFYKSYAVGVI